MLPRAPWVEFETPDPDELMLIHPGWTNSTDGLVVALREAGWFATASAAMHAAETATLSYGWVGVDDDGELLACSINGVPHDAEDDRFPLVEVESVTFAKIGSASTLAPRRTSNRD